MTTVTTQPQSQPSDLPHGVAGSRGLFDRQIMGRALVDAFKKIDPRVQVKNPVMFVVLVGTVVTLIESIAHPSVFDWSITVWLFLTVMFANFAEAMAEGRGKAQADTLRRMRAETEARRLTPAGSEERVAAADLAKGDLVVCEAGDLIPSDGEIIEGIASVDESAITGRVGTGHPRVRRRSLCRHGGHTRALRPHRGAHHGRAGSDIPRPHDHPGRRGQPPEDPERDRPHHPSVGADHRVHPRRGDPAGLRRLLGGHGVDRHPGVVARVPHPDHHRRPPLSHRHRRHGQAGAAQRPRHERTRRRGSRRRADAAARQDRNDHAWQPHGVGLLPGARTHRRGGGRRRPAGFASRRDARREVHCGAG